MSASMNTIATPETMRAYCAQRAACCERVYFKPERQHDLRVMEAALAPLFAGRVHEVLKNFPTREQACAMLGPRAHTVRWVNYEHDWVLGYELF
jgi:hypothetical protein